MFLAIVSTLTIKITFGGYRRKEVGHGQDPVMGVAVGRGLGAGGGAEWGMEVLPVSLRERWAVAAAFGAVWFVWGSTYLAIAWAVETIPPLSMIGVRCVLAGAALYGWARLRGGPRPRAEDWRAAALAGFLLFVTGQAVLAWAETRIASGAASLLIATEPLFITLLAWRGGRTTGSTGAAPTPGTALAVLAGFAGVAVLALPSAGGGLDPLGAGAAVLASLSWSVGVFRAGSRREIGPGQTAGMQLLAAGVILMAIATVSGEVRGFPAGGPSIRSLAALGFLVAFGSVVTFGAYVWLLDRVGPARISTHAYVNPLVAVVLGSVLNGEPVTAGLVGATALILGSVAALLRRGASRSPGRDEDAAHARAMRPTGRRAGEITRTPPRPSEVLERDLRDGAGRLRPGFLAAPGDVHRKDQAAAANVEDVRVRV
ncbi:MAG TPA: EamA family transporter [Longimicrobiales bacterium]|nr:EamA family transporter [Longimicrobiales bacterium]